MPSIPRLHLTHGQVAWSICDGQVPDQRTLDAMRYLRQLGVPFDADEQGVGRGNRLTYHFDHLVECAVAMWAIRRGMKPRAAAGFLVNDRKSLRKLYRDNFRAMPEEALSADWVKSRGRSGAVMSDEQYMRLHPRYAESGNIEMMTIDEVMTYKATPGDLIERHATEVHPLLPLRKVMLEAVAWALVAPVTPPGRVPKKEAASP